MNIHTEKTKSGNFIAMRLIKGKAHGAVVAATKKGAITGLKKAMRKGY